MQSWVAVYPSLAAAPFRKSVWPIEAHRQAQAPTSPPLQNHHPLQNHYPLNSIHSRTTQHINRLSSPVGREDFRDRNNRPNTETVWLQQALLLKLNFDLVTKHCTYQQHARAVLPKAFPCRYPVQTGTSPTHLYFAVLFSEIPVCTGSINWPWYVCPTLTLNL